MTRRPKNRSSRVALFFDFLTSMAASHETFGDWAALIGRQQVNRPRRTRNVTADHGNIGRTRAFTDFRCGGVRIKPGFGSRPVRGCGRSHDISSIAIVCRRGHVPGQPRVQGGPGGGASGFPGFGANRFASTEWRFGYDLPRSHSRGRRKSSGNILFSGQACHPQADGGLRACGQRPGGRCQTTSARKLRYLMI